MSLPSATVITLLGAIAKHIPASDPSGRGPGVDVALEPLAPQALWIIENALQSEKLVRDRSTPVAHAAVVPTGNEANLNDGQAVAEAEDELLLALTAEVESLRRLNAFQILGVGYESDDAEVRASFADLTKRYHPDRFARYQSEKLRAISAEIFILIRDAYRKLGDAQGRANARHALGGAPRAVASVRAQTAPVPPPPTTKAAAAPVAAAAPQPRPLAAPPAARSDSARPAPRAVTTEGLGSIETERRPIAAAPPPVLTEAGIDMPAIEQLLDANNFDAALAAYKVLAKRNPADRAVRAGIELCEGLRALSNRDRLEAAQRFEAVLEIDPSHERAARELAEMRRMATNERKGLLTRLMNKKD